jgi:cytochrome P450
MYLTSTFDVHFRMPYTEATLLEVQRIATVVPLFSRASTQDQYIGEYFVKKVNSYLYSLLYFSP